MQEFFIPIIIFIVVAGISFFLGTIWKRNKVLKKAQEVIENSEINDKEREGAIAKANEQIKENEKILETAKKEEDVVNNAKETIDHAKEVIENAKKKLNNNIPDSN